MAAFSLIGVHRRQGDQQGRPPQPPEESFFLYSGEEIDKYYNCGSHRRFELWHQPPPHQIHEYEFSQARSSMRRALAGAGSGGGGGFSCQDCGNQAKKDCAHLRCRACCKSRGFHCHTHVKSTWIPVAKRRERQQQRVAAATATAASASASASMSMQREAGGGRGSGETSKRPRDITAYTRIPTTATANAAAAIYGGASEGIGKLYPPEVSAEAVFRCVRVSAAGDIDDDEYAYQTAVSIGGHLFKGILYDQGPDQSETSSAGRQPSPNLNYRLNSTHSSSSPATATAAAASPTAAAFLEPYPTPYSSTFMAGTPFFLYHPRP